MKTITDDQIAEIELDFRGARKLGREAYIDMQDGEALIARLREAERWKADASQVLNPLLDYAHSLGLAKLGHSVTEALIEDHKRLREAERDAARYRWILNHYCEFHGDRTLASIALQHGSLDAAIDAAMQESEQ